MTHLLIIPSVDELCESLHQLLLIQPLGQEHKEKVISGLNNIKVRLYSVAVLALDKKLSA